MKSICFFVFAVLVATLACGSGGSDEETAVQTVTEDRTPDSSSAAVTNGELPVTVDDSGTLYLLENGSAGLFAIGLTKDQVEEFSPRYGNVEVREIDLMAEGMATPALELTLEDSGKLILQLSEADFTVCRITVNSSLFTTEQGIGVGSSYANLDSFYDFDGLQWGDGGEPVAIVEDAGMSFIIASGDWWQAGSVEGEVPGDARITGIILW